jgi:predicted DNA binding CopG/RHH family protein
MNNLIKENEMAAEKLRASEEAWEEGRLGQSEEHVRKSGEESEKALDEALNMQLISLRLPKGLINDLKIIAKLNGIGYQPLIRQLLTRFVIGEKKQALLDHLARTRSQEKAQAREEKRREKKAA